MGDWFTSRSFKILVVLLLSVVVLLGVIVTSLPAAVEKALVLGGDYVLGEGTTSVGRVEFRDFDKVRFEKLALKNPPSFPDDPFLEIGPSLLFLSGGSIFSSEPARVEVALGAAEVLVDASVGAEGLKLNLLDVYRKIREQIPAKEQEESAQSSEAGPRVLLSRLSIQESRLTGQIRLPGGRVESLSVKIPAIEYVPEPDLSSDQTSTVGELYREALDMLIGTALRSLEFASEKWELSKSEREAFLLMLRSWSDEGVSDLVKDRVQGQVKKVLEERLPSGLKGILGGDDSSED